MSGKTRRASRSRMFQRKALALAIGGSVALAFAGGAFAQAVNGTIAGRVPIAPNETIQITGGAGFNRTITVGPSGQYSVILPVGTYTVSLLQGGKVVQSRTDVTPTASGAVTVDFTSTTGARSVQTLSTINVTANAIPAIDVTSTNQSNTVTATQLNQLPLGRNAESIALMAPGVTPGSALLQNSNPTATGNPLLVFGGASVAENAYYIDGMNTTDALTGQGGVSLPYGAIEQQQTITSGYGAKYGRSIGGVINQIGKSGSNEWHFGFRGIWQPGSWRSSYVDQLYDNPRNTTPGQLPGDMYRRRSDNHYSENIYDAYVSGPIIKDKLLFFVGLESDNIHSNQVSPVGANTFNDFTTIHRPKIYAKLNWNINDSNFLTLTGAQVENKTWTSRFGYDYSSGKTGSYILGFPASKNAFRMWVANYTSYLTDNLTLHAMFGKLHGEYYQEPPASPLPYIFGAASQNPAFAPPGGIVNTQTSADVGNPAHKDSVTNYRVDLDWKLPWRFMGTHDLQVGIDNSTTWDIGDGSVMTGPGYAWSYGSQLGPPTNTLGPGDNITGTDPSIAPYIGPPNSNPDGATGYYVSKYIFENAASVRVAQRAAYIQDNWQVTPNLLLKLGLRDDTFVNYNPAGQAYIRLTKPQWEPRIGFSWDVNGDSTFKVYGNAGRYYLALPAGVALRGAGASTFTDQYFTYNGIDPNGIPQGLTPIPENPVGGVSQNNEYGLPLDPRTVASTNIKAEYADAYVLGMQHKLNFLNTDWVFGANGIYKKLGRIVDDWDDQQRMCAAGLSEGYAWLTPQNCTNYTLGAVLINPGETQTIQVASPSGGLVPVTVDMAQQGFEKGVVRKYYAINLSLEHPWDGKWWGQISYTFARNWGNTEGPVDSIIGQGGSSVSITEQWDFYQIMQGSYGLLPNDQKHQFKIADEYAITPEWMVGGNLFIASGHPDICLGNYPTAVTPNYGPQYHFCNGEVAPPGSTGFTPWTHQLALNVIYQPNWAGRKLAFKLDVFNVFNNQTALQYRPYYPLTTYHRVEGWVPPRYLRFTVAYDW
jgi:hypothetical protein